ncbi:MAG: hydrolase [Pseudonocardiales bacterium]|nr:hydrolase [Pseudonocardiales bacterium]
MGGPFWARKDEAAWSMPKGEHGPDEAPFEAARREFAEELGSPAPDVHYVELGSVRASGKTVTAWAGAADFAADSIVSGTFEMEWPPRSGRTQSFPEIDRAQWFGLDEAAVKLVKGQRPFLQRLSDLLAQEPGR